MADSTLDIFGAGDDPFGGRNALAGGRVGGSFTGSRLAAAPREPAKYPPLGDAEAEPLKQSLLDRTVSGLHYVGSTMDKLFGARALRGLAAGKPHELLSAIPGSDTVGLTKPEDAVSMDDLLTKHYKVFKENDPDKWEFRDFAIPALEIAADPGTWINPLGAATKAGRLASGAGHTGDWTRKMLTQGFEHTAPELRAAGHSAETIAHMGRQGTRIASDDLLAEAARQGVTLGAGTPLRGSLGLSLPFSSQAAATLGHGKFGQALAGVQDELGAGLKALPGVANLRSLFDPAAMGAQDPRIQHAAATYGAPAREAMAATTRAGEHQMRTQLDALMANHRAIPGVESEALRVMRGAAEDASPVFTDPTHWQADLMRRHGTVLGPGRTLATGVQDPHAVAAHILANWQELQDMGLKVRTFGQDVRSGAKDVGLMSHDVNDRYAAFAARRYIGAVPGAGPAAAAQGRQFPTLHGSNLARKSPLKDVPGGADQLDEWAINPAFSGSKRTGTDAQVAAGVYADMLRHEQLIAGPAVAAGSASRLLNKANEVAGWLKTVPDVHAAHGVPFYNPDLVGDYAMLGQRHAGTVGSATSATRAATSMARPVADFAGSGEEPVKLGSFLNNRGRAGLISNLGMPVTPAEEAAVHAAGFDDLMHLRTVAGNTAIATPPELAMLAKVHPDVARRAQVDEWHGAAVRAYEQMAAKGFGPVEDAISGKVNPITALNDYGLTHQQANDIAGFHAGWVTPEEVKPILGRMAGAHTFFKNAVYPMWPASHFRNAVSAAWNNMLHGTGLGDYADAARVMRGGAPKDPARYALTAGLAPQDAGQLLNRNAYAHGKVYSGVSQFEDNVGGRGLQDEHLVRGLAGQARLTPSAPGVQEPLREALARPGMLNPFAQQGVGGGWFDKLTGSSRTAPRTADAFAPLVLGRRVGGQVEDYVRMANYLGNMRQGMGSEAAGMLTRKIHFDYSNMTPFERNVMKQVMPFYTFMRNNLPYQMKMMAERPGSVAPVLHAMGATNPNAPWVPEHLASGAAIPWGSQEDGTQRYLGSFGLPLEEAMGRFKFKNYTLPGGHKANLPAPLATLGGFLGDTSPYLKAPVEAITDYQLKTGRKLSELHSKGAAGGYGLLPEEYAQPLTQIVANSPLSRVASSLNTAVDPRKSAGIKATNLLTGARVVDFDRAKAEAQMQRAEIDAILKGNPNVAQFTNFYAKPGQPISPEVANQLRLFGTLKKEAKAFHDQQAAKEHLRQLYGGR